MTKIAIASCMKIKNCPVQPAWAKIERENPDLLILLGDNVYGPNKWGGFHDELKKNYEKQFAEPNFTSLISKVPYIVTWDDHDFGPNNSFGTSKGGLKHRDASLRLFNHYFKEAINVDCKENSKIYGSFRLTDDIKIIVLETRYFKEKNKYGSLLGKSQEEFLFDELNGDQKFTIIATGTTINSGSKKWERWSDYTRFIKKFRKKIKPLKKLIVVSGDIHENKFVRHKNGKNNRFYEIISSGAGQWNKYKTYMDNYRIIEFSDNLVNVRLLGNHRKNRISKTINALNGKWELLKK